MREDRQPAALPLGDIHAGADFGATTMVRFSYVKPRMSMARCAVLHLRDDQPAVGFGDFSLRHSTVCCRWFAIGLMLRCVTITAILVALISDLLLSAASSTRPVCDGPATCATTSSSSAGIYCASAVVSDLAAAGYDVVVIEQDENNRLLSTVAKLDVPVIFGDSTRRTDAGIGARSRSRPWRRGDDPGRHGEHPDRHRPAGKHWGSDTKVPIVLRVQGRALSAAVNQQFGFENVRSVVDLAAPWFIGAAMGLQVLGTFWVGQRSWSWSARCW